MRCISIVRSLYFKTFSASFLITFRSPEIATSINIYVPASLSRIIMSVCGWVWFYQFVLVDSTIWLITLPPLLDSTDFGTCSYQCFLSSCTPVSLHMLKCRWANTLSCLFVYCSFASIGHADIMWSIPLSNCWQILHLLLLSMLNILLRSISFVTLGLVRPLFHFQFLLLDLPSIVRGTCLLH